VAAENGVYPNPTRSNYTHELMIDHFHIQVEDWPTVKEDPSVYGNWDEASLWAMINDDFSRLTLTRWNKLKKRIHFPRVENIEGEEEKVVPPPMPSKGKKKGRVAKPQENQAKSTKTVPKPSVRKG